MMIEALVYVASVCAGAEKCVVEEHPVATNRYTLYVCEDIYRKRENQFMATGGQVIYIDTIHLPLLRCNERKSVDRWIRKRN
ncbi:MAG: hypothetical protein KJO91_10905 [Gammaproteobacteria bacterium]|nr:hypothetical protein [Gammaproteobacteria bacterium]